ncbi:hypothetical protein RJ639_012772 [Escallonia herrerae]|uniref:KIB1-4 beta-propeller domain-containing protein n=1 Tax=Escallonia herrerae TaxID=1293975 RepID=A0AA89AP21_9ASTE|nr:hypothetical protein RJ639_012772 [Escallonia herrerae]
MFSGGVVVIYGFESKICFLKYGDDAWTGLDQHGRKHKPYSDIICHDDMLLALSEGCTIEMWDVGASCQRKVKEIQASFPGNPSRASEYLGGLWTNRFYLVESLGDLLLVERYVGEFVRHDGVPVYEPDLLTGEDNHPLVCPYRTLRFQVYRLNSGERRWEEVKDLGDRVLFLGGNQSVSLPAREFSGNSIYFTDDYRSRMDEDYLYGGHDLGVFSLESGVIKPFYPCDSGRIEPPPILDCSKSVLRIGILHRITIFILNFLY